MLQERIVEDMKTAMKAKDKNRLSVIRMLRAAMKDKEIEVRHALVDEDIYAVIAKLIKQRKDSAAQYAAAGRSDLQTQEEAEVQCLQCYLPEPLSDAEVKDLIERALSESSASGIRDMGKVMAALRPLIQGRADMGQVSAMVKGRLQAL